MNIHSGYLSQDTMSSFVSCKAVWWVYRHGQRASTDQSASASPQTEQMTRHPRVAVTDDETHTHTARRRVARNDSAWLWFSRGDRVATVCHDGVLCGFHHL